MNPVCNCGTHSPCYHPKGKSSQNQSSSPHTTAGLSNTQLISTTTTTPDVPCGTQKVLAPVPGKATLYCARYLPATFTAQKPVSGNAPLILPYSFFAHLIQVTFHLHHLSLILEDLQDLHSLLTMLFLLAKGRKKASKQH